ncbi:MAG: peptidylprolyl isomerase [FCB group bacterium]|nr:peptidylprolyl isomerase [FCB group bacterium]
MRLQCFRGGLAAAMLWTAAAAAQAPNLDEMDLVLRSVPNGPVASVRGKMIEAKDYREQYLRTLAEISARAGGKGVDDAIRFQLGMQTLRRLVADEILAQDAVRLKLEVPAEDLDKAWQNELKILEEQTKKEGQPASSEAELLQRAGTTRDAARAELRKVMLIDRMRERIAKDNGVAVSDAEIDKYLKEHAARFDSSTRYHIRHILVRPEASTLGKPTDSDKAKARNEAEQALGRIRSGQSFEAVAKEVSDAPRKEEGGDMGLMRLDDMGPVLSEAVKKLKPGEISGVIESDYGCHLVQLVDTQAGEKVDTEAIKPRIRKGLLAEKAEEAVQKYIEKVAQNPDEVRVYLRLDKQLEARPDLQKKLSQAGQ